MHKELEYVVMAHIETFPGGPEHDYDPDPRRTNLRENSQLISWYRDFYKLEKDAVRFNSDSMFTQDFRDEIDLILRGKYGFLADRGVDQVQTIVWKEALSNRPFGKIFFINSFDPKTEQEIQPFVLTDYCYYTSPNGQLLHAIHSNHQGVVREEDLFAANPVDYMTPFDTFSDVPLLEMRDGYVSWNYREAQRIRQDEY